MQLGGYTLRLYDLEDKEVGRDIRVPTIPPIGSQLSMAGQRHIWEVISFPQFNLHHPKSVAASDGDPITVELQVRPGNGIHKRRTEGLEPLEG